MAVNRREAFGPVLDHPNTLNSETLIGKLDAGLIPRAHNEMLGDFVALLGSTHEKALWREESSLGLLAEKGILGYTPWVEKWERHHAKAEARALSEASVIGLRLENKNIKNGSVGSIIEWGFAVLSSKLNGQRLVVSIEAGFEQSLTDPAVKAQFQALREMLNDVKEQSSERVEEHAELADFNAALVKAREEQKHEATALKPMTKEDFKAFYQKRLERLNQESRKVVLSGSSGAFGSLAEEQFHLEQELLARFFPESDSFEALNVGERKEEWDTAHDQQDELLLRAAFKGEKGAKARAEILLWVIQNEAISLSAVTELGFLLAQALETGQQVAVLHESFDADFYVQNFIYDQSDSSLIEEVRDLLSQAKEEGRPFSYAVIKDAVKIIQQGKNPQGNQGVTFTQIQENALLSETTLFRKADTARRARELAKEQFLLLQKRIKELTGETENEPFILATDFADFLQKLQFIKDPKSLEKRTAYWEGFKTFKNTLEQLCAQENISAYPAVDVLSMALDSVRPKEQRLKDLEDHLDEVSESAAAWRKLLLSHPDKNGTTYLTDRQLELIQTVVAPLHDMLKFLGNKDQQVMPDHELLIEYIIKTYFPKLGFTPEEVAFMAAVAGDHENIFKEKERNTFVTSPEDDKRGKALFFVLDTLTGVIELRGDTLDINEAVLRERFTNLYFRHIDLEAGKIYRPEWGFSTFGDIAAFFEEMEQKYSLKLAPGCMRRIVEIGGVEAIDSALNANALRPLNHTKRFDDGQLRQLAEIRQQLVEKYLATR